MSKSSVLITRPEPKASQLAAQVQALGFHPIVSPLFKIVQTEVNWQKLEFESYDAIIATSDNAFKFVPKDVAELLAAFPFFVAGPVTAAAARKNGFQNIRVSTNAGGGIFDLLAKSADGSFNRLLYLAGENRKAFLEQRLNDMVHLDVVETYKAEPLNIFTCEAKQAIEKQKISSVIFFSERACTHFEDLLAGLDPRIIKAFHSGCIVIALSDEIAIIAKQLGYIKVESAVNLSTSAVLQKLVDQLT